MSSMISYRQLHQLLTTLFKEIIRQPAVIFWGIIFPILMALGLGVAFTQKTDIVRHVAVIDTDLNTSRIPKMDLFLNQHTSMITAPDVHPVRFEILLKDENLGNSIFIFQKANWQQAMVLLKRGNLSIILEEKDGKICYHFDPLNTDAQLSYLKLSKIFEGKNILEKKSGAAITPLTVHGTRYIDFLVPGLISMGIMMSCMWGMSYGMIDKRSKKLLRRMVATPMKKSHFLMALMTVRIAMNLIESTLLFIFAWLAFDITIQGSILALLLFFIAGNISFGGIAIFTSSRTSNTEIGNGLINAVVMPMMVLSGIFFSYHNFPDWSIPVIQKLPLTLLADGIRNIFIEGAGFTEIIIPACLLFGIGIIFFTAGLRVFKWH